MRDVSQGPSLEFGVVVVVTFWFRLFGKNPPNEHTMSENIK